MIRGDLVIVDFRPTNPKLGVRPALVIQNDRDNARMSNTIVTQVTTNLRRMGQDTQLIIDRSHSDWTISGLRHPSVVNCSNVYTIEQGEVARVIGALSAATMQKIDDCLKAALGLA
ncbi:MAG: type II toxin-antitoxin system PemK/MazF family toxin [Pirellulales bacterium]